MSVEFGPEKPRKKSNWFVKMIKVLTAPFWLLKFLLYRWAMFVVLNSYLAIYIYEKFRIGNWKDNSWLGIPTWSYVLILGLILLLLGTWIAYTIANRKNVIKGH